MDHPWVEFVEPQLVMQAHGVTTQTLTPGTTTYSYGIDRIDQRTNPLDSMFVYEEPTLPVALYVLDTGVRLTHQGMGTTPCAARLRLCARITVQLRLIR